MYIKLIGENENGFPLDCTVGKVYKTVIYEDQIFFIGDNHKWNFSFKNDMDSNVGNWQVVDKNGEDL